MLRGMASAGAEDTAARQSLRAQLRGDYAMPTPQASPAISVSPGPLHAGMTGQGWCK